MEHLALHVKEMTEAVEEMVETATAEIAAETDSVEAITVVAVMKTVWTGIGNVLSVTITTSQEETSVTDAVYLVPAAAVAEATEAVVMVEEILVEAAAVAEATEAVVMAEEIPVEAVAVAEATEAVVMVEEIPVEAVAVAEATEAAVMAEEILDEAAVAVAMAAVMAVEILVKVTIDVREEMTHLEENQKVQNLDTQKERNQVMLTTVDQVKLGHKVTKETEIEVI